MLLTAWPFERRGGVPSCVPWLLGGPEGADRGDATVSTETVRDYAAEHGVCVRPLLRRVTDRVNGTVEELAIACGSTRESACPPCAEKARVLRMQQCAEGWHRDHEPAPRATTQTDHGDDLTTRTEGDGARRVRSTRRRQDAPDLPRVPLEDRTVGQTFTAPDGTTYRPSMFLTLTLPSYGPIIPGTRTSGAGSPVPGRYDYRRAALDALLFPKLVDRFWQNLRRCAGYRVQYFAAVEPQRRLAPHLHAAIRGAIPRHPPPGRRRRPTSRCGGRPFDQPVYVDRRAARRGTAETTSTRAPGRSLPTWDQALDQLDADPDARPAHVMRFGSPDSTCAASSPPHPTPTAPSATSSNTSPSPSPKPTPTPTTRTRHTSAHRPAARGAALPALLTGVCELAPLRHPTRRRRSRDAPRLVRRRKPTTGRTSASAAAASWSPANGPAKPSPSTAPTAPPSSAKPWPRPASSPPRSNGSPPTSCPPTDYRGSWVDRHPYLTRSYARVILASIAERQRWQPSTKPRRPHAAACGQSRQPPA